MKHTLIVDNLKFYVTKNPSLLRILRWFQICKVESRETNQSKVVKPGLEGSSWCHTISFPGQQSWSTNQFPRGDSLMVLPLLRILRWFQSCKVEPRETNESKVAKYPSTILVFTQRERNRGKLADLRDALDGWMEFLLLFFYRMLIFSFSPGSEGKGVAMAKVHSI